ncbi:hypothetical protein ES708_19454 [subsurface metagenome]
MTETRTYQARKEYHAEWRRANPEKWLEYRREAQRNLRLEILEHYGGSPPSCACCGEITIQFLTIDHINGMGRAERKLKKAQGGYLYGFLKRNGFPSGYRVLCYNCNCSIGHYGYCPHHNGKAISEVGQ